MEQLGYFCLSSCLFMLAITLLTVALLRHGLSERTKNRRVAELIWQARNRNTDWWLDINRKDEK